MFKAHRGKGREVGPPVAARMYPMLSQSRRFSNNMVYFTTEVNLGPEVVVPQAVCLLELAVVLLALCCEFVTSSFRLKCSSHRQYVATQLAQSSSVQELDQTAS